MLRTAEKVDVALSLCYRPAVIIWYRSGYGIAHMIFPFRPCIAFQLLLLSAPYIALGEPALAGSDTETSTKPGWIITLGGNVEYGPSYPGSSHQSFGVMPSFDVRRFGEPDQNSAPDDNIDYTLFEAGGFEAGPVLGFRDRRSTADDERLVGLHKIEWTPDIGIFAQQWLIPNELRLRTEVRQALSNGSGIVADFGADWFVQLSDKWTVSVGPRLSVSSSRYMKKYFSVSDSEAAANGSVGPYQASGGIQSVGVTVSASYQVTPTLSLGVYNRFDRMVGSAADSSITQAFGKENQNTIGVSLTKSFQVNF